jgi:hypothetical protein
LDRKATGPAAAMKHAAQLSSLYWQSKRACLSVKCTVAPQRPWAQHNLPVPHQAWHRVHTALAPAAAGPHPDPVDVSISASGHSRHAAVNSDPGATRYAVQESRMVWQPTRGCCRLAHTPPSHMLGSCPSTDKAMKSRNAAHQGQGSGSLPSPPDLWEYPARCYDFQAVIRWCC